MGRVLPAMAILLLGGSLAACSTAPRRTEAQRTADADTAARVETALSADPHLYLAASVPGVRAVSDEMELMRGGGRK